MEQRIEPDSRQTEEEIPSPEESASLIQDSISSFVEKSPHNRLGFIDNSPIFDPPLVAFASGDDPLFTQYKEIIGDFHMTPRDVLALEQPQVGTDETVSVICWVLPKTSKTRISNRRRELTPSLRWAHARTYGEQFNDLLRGQIVTTLREMGHVAVAPFLTTGFKWIEREDGPTSTWSERHACYAAGLGTFSLSDGFITPVGIAMRCGSVVTNLALPPSDKRYQDHLSNCLYHRDRSCGLCIDRCPAGAITSKGHDKRKCQGYMRDELPELKERYSAEVPGCGLCQTGVPCESRIPA